MAQQCISQPEGWRNTYTIQVLVPDFVYFMTELKVATDDRSGMLSFDSSDMYAITTCNINDKHIAQQPMTTTQNTHNSFHQNNNSISSKSMKVTSNNRLVNYGEAHFSDTDTDTVNVSATHDTQHSAATTALGLSQKSG